jgi:hypothetical protein
MSSVAIAGLGAIQQPPSQPLPGSATGGAATTTPVSGAIEKSTDDVGKRAPPSHTRYWPPLSHLKSYLDKLKFEIASLPTLSSGSRAFLDLYADVLRGGVGRTFLRRKSASVGAVLAGQGGGARKVEFPKYVESATTLGLIVRDGDVEVEVDTRMEEHAEEVSRDLDLDALQSLYLVWMYSSGGAPGEASGDGDSYIKRAKTGEFSSSPGTATPYSLAGVCQLYCDERLSLLRSLETILWIGEDPVAESEVRDYVESRLIDGLLFGRQLRGVATTDGNGSDMDVEDVLLVDLKVALASYKQSTAYKAVIIAKGNEENVNWAKIVVQGMERERIKMLTLLSLIYYRPRKACSVARFEELLGLGQVVDAHSTSAPSLSSSRSASILAVGRESRMYVLLLLEVLVLEVNDPLRAVAERGTHDQYPFLAADVALRITEMMRRLVAVGAANVGDGGRSSPYLSVLVLTWASILLVLSDDEEQKRMGRELAQLCAGSGADNGGKQVVLQHLNLVSSSNDLLENSKQMTQLSSLIVYHSVAIFLAAWDFGENERVTGQLVDILGALLAQDSVNDMFLYNHDDALTQPVLRFLAGLGALSVEQLKMLTAISSSHAGSVFAYAYLMKVSSMPHSAMLLTLRQFMENKDGTSLETAAVILNFYDALCSSNSLTVMDLLDVASENGDESISDFVAVLGLCISRAPVGDQQVETAVLAAGILTSAFKLMSYFVPYSPNRVMTELLANLGVSPVSFKLEFFDQMMTRSSTEAGYKAVTALFQLVSVMLQTAYGPGISSIMMSMKMIRIAVPYVACMASSEEKWNLAADCLTIVRHALMRSGRLAPNASVAEDVGQPVSNKDVLELIFPILPPECKYIANDVEHQGETEAIEKCVVKWLRLVPVLLSDGPPVYEYLFQSVNGRNPPASTLLSYLSYPYFGSEDKAAVVRSMAHLLGYDTNVPVTAFLPKDGPRLSLLESCMVISNSINAVSPTHVESLFSAACDVLCNAVSYHPTLAVLLLPDLSIPAAGRAAGALPDCSCTQHILSFAERASELYVSHPMRLEKVLDVICAAITSKKSRNGIMTSLIPNGKIWSAFMDILLRSTGDDVGSDRKSEGAEDDKGAIDVHRFNVEMKVMDIFVAAVCSADMLDMDGKDADSAALWRHVDDPVKKHLGIVSTALIRRYCGLIKRMNINEEMLRARRLAWLAGLQVLVFALNNKGLCQSLQYENDSLVANLKTCILKRSGHVQNPSRENLLELCQGLYGTFVRLDDSGGDICSMMYQEPYLSMANLLLELEVGPLPLPNQIGSAWSKVVEEFSPLEAQSKRLKELTRLQSCLYECISSLGTFVAVCSDRHPKIFGVGGSVADLVDIIDVVENAIRESSMESEDILVSDNVTASVAAAVVDASRLAVLLSHEHGAHIVDERRLFELLAFLTEHQGVEYVDESLACWLSVCINVESGMQTPTNAFDASGRNDVIGVFPTLLSLIGASHTRVSCSASSLVMILMASRVRPAAWEEQVESLNLPEMLGRLVTQGADTVPPYDVTVRIKSLLLLASQMTTESDHVANGLVSKGLGDAIVSVCHWLTDALPSVGCAANVPPSEFNAAYLIDLAGMYTESGTRFEVHAVWCVVLSLCSLLSAALPGHQKVEALLLRVSVSMAGRIEMALRCPTGTSNQEGPQFLTLGYLEEGRAALGFICALSRLEGVWLISQPKMATHMRRLTARFVEFAACDIHKASFAAISPEELSKNGMEAVSTPVRTPLLFGADPVLQLSTTGEPVGEAGSEVTELSLTMAGHLYAMIKYALDFQLISAPEICESEAACLAGKDTWAPAQALENLLTGVASLLDNICDDQASREMGITRSLACRLMDICENATSLLSQMSCPPTLASSLAAAATAKLRSIYI